MSSIHDDYDKNLHLNSNIQQGPIKNKKSHYQPLFGNNGKLVNYTPFPEIFPNGQIDKIEQGFKGDCMLLAMLSGLNDINGGPEAFAKCSVPDGEGGTYITIHPEINGTPRTYHITKEDLEKARNNTIKTPEIPEELMEKAENRTFYSIADADVTALEIAVERYAEEMVNKNPELYDNSGDSFGFSSKAVHNAYKNMRLNHGLITGDRRIGGLNPDNPNDGGGCCTIWQKVGMLGYLENKSPNDNVTMYTSFKESSIIPGYTIDKDGKVLDSYRCKIFSNHAYNIKSIETNQHNQKFVVLENPWQEDNEIRIPYNTFINHSKAIHFSGDKDAYNILMQGITTKTPTTDFEKEAKDETAKLYKQAFEFEYNKMIVAIKNGSKKDQINSIRQFFERMEYTKKQKISFNDAEYAYFFTRQLKDSIEDLVKIIDTTEYGWGSGNDKKDLMMEVINPIYDMLISQLDKNSNSDWIKHIQYKKETLVKELDSMFYTDEKVISKILKELCSDIQRKTLTDLPEEEKSKIIETYNNY